MVEPASAADPAYQRNSRERLKKAKAPIGILSELPSLVRQGYEKVSEDDLVRLQWHGFYHDRPKSGGFLLRVKIPGGRITPSGLRRVGELSIRFGQGYGEITTRQDLQLHSLRLENFADVLRELRAEGLGSLGACGDVVRNITTCPLAGIDGRETFDVRPVVRDLTRAFEDEAYADLPRKHKITVTACPDRCSLPEIHCQAYTAVSGSDGEPGFALHIGGGLSTVPRIARPLGVFVPGNEVVAVARALVDVWKDEPAFRRSFTTARLKFAVDKLGVEEFRRRIAERLGRTLEDAGPLPPVDATTAHLGVHVQTEPGLVATGFAVASGRVSGERMIAIADAVDGLGEPRADIRLTQRQNLVVTHVPEPRLDAFVTAIERTGLRLGDSVSGRGVACTGKPFCNFAIAETKDRLLRVVAHLESVFGDRVRELQTNLDGCPHACGHHWIGDIGLMGTTKRLESGEKIECFDVILGGGGRGEQATIGRPIARRVPAATLERSLERLVRAFLDREADDRFRSARFRAFCRDTEDSELSQLLTPDEENPS